MNVIQKIIAFLKKIGILKIGGEVGLKPADLLEE